MRKFLVILAVFAILAVGAPLTTDAITSTAKNPVLLPGEWVCW